MRIVHRLVAHRHLRVLERAESADQESLAGARQNLTSLGRSIIPELLDLLPRAESRQHAVAVLSEILTDESLPSFVEALAVDNRHAVAAIQKILAESTRYTSSELLGFLEMSAQIRVRLEPVLAARLRDIPARQVLAFLTESSLETRKVLFGLLENHDDPAIARDALPLLDHSEWGVRLHAVRLLASIVARVGGENIDTEEIATAVGVLLARDSNKAVRLEAVKTLGVTASKSSLPQLCAALRDPDLKVHTAAIDVLVRLGDVSAVPFLVEVLKDESEYARRGAVEVLNEVATSDAVRDLVRALGDEDWWVRVRAADALGTLGGEKVVDAVLDLLETGDEFSRRYAVEILNAVPNPRAVDHLIKALADPDWWVRERAIDALAQIGDPRAVDPLIELMQSDAEAAPLCARALGAIGDERAVDPLRRLSDTGTQEIKREALDALVAISQEDVSPEKEAVLREVLADAGVRRQSRDTRPMIRPKSRDPEAGRAQRPPVRSTPPLAPPPVAGETPAASAPSPPAPVPVAGDPSAAGAAPPATPLPTASNQPGIGPGAGAPQTPPAGVTPADGLPRPPAAAGELQPDTMLLNRYRVIRKIGTGGFGSVYLVEDTAVQDEMIFKILSPHISADETIIARFVQELKYARQITHKHVIRIYDFLDLGGVNAISMEYFPGKDLGSIIENDGKIEFGRCLDITAQICQGLEAAHTNGIIHRDIKPANVLVGDDDEVKIVDFGLASMAQHNGSRLTKSGILIGTPHYMAPEQITGEKVDQRADIYSLGVVMYEMLTGTQPFQGDNAVNILFQHLEGEASPVQEIVKDLPDEVEQLVARAMAKERDDRFANVGEFLEAIRIITKRAA